MKLIRAQGDFRKGHEDRCLIETESGTLSVTTRRKEEPLIGQRAAATEDLARGKCGDETCQGETVGQWLIESQ